LQQERGHENVRRHADQGAKTMSRPRLILHPSDFSSASRPAFAQAIASAKEHRAPLLVVHVLAPVILTGDYIAADVYEGVMRSARDHAERQLDALVVRAKKAGARATGLLLEGIAAEQIVRAARGRRAGMIVMGTHGRTGLARLFLGSVAERVIGNAPCPVLTVRARK
jgi:nucleotide-binding universal stress UspA family protein